MIEVECLSKAYGTHSVLQNTSLRIGRGEIALLVGSNGTGKSTLLRALAGVGPPDGGYIAIAGHGDPNREIRARAALAYLPQNPAFHPRFTVGGLLNFYAGLRGLESARVGEVADQTGLHDRLGTPAGKLSGGMRQRLGIALLLLPGARVLLLDEPGLSLDPEWRERLSRLLQHEAERGASVLLATHLLSEWKKIPARVLECREGRVTETGSEGVAQEKENTAPAALSQAEESPQLFRFGGASPVPLLRREAVSAFFNRFLQVFGLLALLGGAGAALAGETVEAVAALATQAALYFIPVFALLLGTSSARSEEEEWPILLSQPLGRGMIPLAKFASGAAGFALLLLALFTPAALVGVPVVTLAALYLPSAALAAVFIALGLWCGLAFGDRIRALLAAAVLWLVFFLLYDLAALSLAGIPFMQGAPDAWTALLMLNPVDAFRIHLLFTLEQVAPESAAGSPLAAWWIAHSGFWIAFLTLLWCGAALRATGRAMEKTNP